MNLDFCPNKKSKEFLEMVSALGGEDKAYLFWMRNKGNHLEKAPNGADSKLFSTLLDYFEGNRTLAIRAKAKVYTNEFFNWFGKWIEDDKENVSKVVDENGEPLVVYHGSPEHGFTVFSKNSPDRFDRTTQGLDKKFYFTKDRIISRQFALNDEELRALYFTDPEEGDYSDIEIHNDELDNRVYPVFLNIRKPVQINAKGKAVYQLSDSERKEIDNSEGAIIQNVLEQLPPKILELMPKADTYLSHPFTTDYLVSNPNQIKSATSNKQDVVTGESGFSTTDDDIYHHIDKKVSGTGNLLDEIPKEGATTQQVVNNVVDFLKNKFVGLDIEMYDDVSDIPQLNDDDKRVIGILSSNKNIKSMVYRGKVYIIQSRLLKQGGQIASEEILHVLVKTLQQDNQALFQKLLKEARATFKKLTKEIESTYESLGQDTINNEIVTQALARFVNRDIQQHRHSKFADLVELFVEWLKGIVRNAAEKLGSTVYIDPTQLKDLTLQELSDLVNAEDTRFDINISSDSTFYNLSDNSSMNSILESNDQEELLKKAAGDNAHLKVTAINTAINNTREAFVQRQVEKYLITNEDASAADIYGVRIGSSVDWDEAAVKRVITEQQEKLAKVFGLVKRELPNGGFVYTSSDKSKNSRLRVAFVNSITGEDWTDESGIKHKGVFEEGTKAEEAAWNAIYISIQDGDATTFVHEMVHYYIRTFWESQAVQDALVEVAHQNKMAVRENEDMLQYSKKLEEKLVEWITDEVTSEPKLTFWERINKLLHSFGKDINKDQNVRNNVLDTLQAAFSINEDLSDRVAEIIYFEKYIGPVHQDEMRRLSDEVDEIDGTTFWKIKSTLESREKSERSRGKADNYDLLNIVAHLQKILKRSITNKDDITNTVSDFLLLAAQDIQRAIGTLSDIVLGGDTAIENLDIDDFMHLKTDVVGYYDTMLTNAIDEYLRDSKNITPELRAQLLTLKNNILPNIALLKRNFDVILKHYVDKKIEQYADELVTIGDKDIFITNMKLWARNQIDGGDLAFMENALGPAVVSRSPIVRLIEYLVTALNRISYESALTVGHELVDKYKKCASIGRKLMSVNFMKQFCELDDDGQPTGYFVRQYNYGKLYKQRDKIIKKLVDKYNLTVDDDTNQITFRNRSEYIKYMTDFYNEMDKVANFRYKKEYYIKRAELLSPKAQEKERIIQRQIDTLLKKAVDKELGVPMIFNLSSEEIKQLDNLRREKQNLANPYNIVYNADGSILSIEEKTGEDLEIAKEFILWNAFKAGKIKYKSNWEKFNSVRDRIVEKYGEDSYQVKLFDYKYKARKISNKFYEKLGNNKASAEIQELYARRSAIINSIQKKLGYYQPNLKLLNDQAFAELKRIDQELSRLFSEDVSNATGFDSGVNPVNFSDIALKSWVAEYDENGRLTTNTAYNYFVNKEKAQRQASGQSLLDESAYTYENLTGTHVLSVFRYTQPREEDMVEDVLMGEYSELDLNSELVNTDFRDDIQEELQPKNLEEYKNKNWEIIQSDPKLKDFYDTLLKVMHDAYSLLPNFDADKMQYVMPQMRDRDAKLMFRNRHFITNMGASVADAFTIVETDTKYNETFSQRADGSFVETIPIRWVSKLKDPSIICTDLTKSVTLFYEMAQNYKNKADINPMLLAMLFQVLGGFSDKTKEGGQTDQAERILKYLLMYVYGRTRTGFKSNKPMSKRAMAVSLITDTILSKAHAKLMNHNWRAVLKNFVDSFLTDTGEILSGKYITVKDALWANGQMAKELFSTARSFGRANNKSLISALMQLNGVSGGIGEIFAQHNETWLRRVLSKHFAMGEYTLVDYTFKGHLTASLYHSIRLVKNPITKELEYMTKDLAMFHYHDAGLRMEDGVKAWKRAKITLFDAYEVDDKGNAVVKEKYKKYVYPTIKATGQQSRRLVNQVTGTIRERTSVINGILDQSGNAAWKQNVAGALVLLMRGWMITQMWDNLKDGNDFAEYESQWRQVIDDDVNVPISIPGIGGSQKKRSINGLEYRVRQEDPEYHGQYNFETGTVETGQWRGLWSSFKHGLADLTSRIATAYKHIRKIENSEEYKKKLTRNERYKLRRISTMAATFLIVCALTYITTGLRIKYPDEWYMSLLNAVNISVISERASQLPIFAPLSILDIVNSIVISKTLIEDADKIVNSIEDVIEMSKDVLFNTEDSEYDNPVKSGAYKGLPKYQRDFLKTGSYIFPDLSIDNVFRSMSKSGNEASINYYIHNVSPTKQAVGVAENVMPWMFDWTGTDLGFTPQEKKKKSKAQYSNF